MWRGPAAKVALMSGKLQSTDIDRSVCRLLKVNHTNSLLAYPALIASSFRKRNMRDPTSSTPPCGQNESLKTRA